MPSWSDFTNAISTVKAVGTRLTGGGSTLTPDELEKEKALHNTVKDALSTVDKEISKVPGVNAVQKAAAKTGDWLLKGAVALNNNIISPYVTRPIATAALLTDSTSPLYKKGQYEEGFQFDDIKAAYERSAKVSTMQALTKSNMIPGIKPLSASILANGKINIDKVDLWNDQSIQKNYVDNAVGRWFTGIGDFVVGNAALGAVGKVAGKAAQIGGAKAGLYTANKTIDDLATDMESGILHAETNGAKGSQTVSGTHMSVLAETKDYGIISDIVDKYSTNGRLINLIREASSARAVKDLILADKGDIDALSRLAATAPDDLFDLSGTAHQLQAKFIQTGESYIPQGTAVERLKTAYDAAIEKEPQFKKLRDAFFSEDNALTPGGKAYMPIEPIAGKSALIKGQKIVRDIKGEMRFREYAKTSEFLELKLGKGTGSAITSFVRTAGRGTESLPTGFVTFSGVRPLDGRLELNAFLNNLKLFSNGAKKIYVAPGIEEYVSSIRSRFEEAYMKSIGGNQIEALDKIDAEIGRLLAYQVGIWDEKEIANHISKFRQNVNSGLAGIKANGFGVGHDGRRIEVAAQTMRQIEESYRFTPWDSIENQMNLTYNPSKIKSGIQVTKNVGAQAFRDLNRVWTFDVLVRPMYIAKQSIAEPIVSATMAQGIEFIYKDVIGNPLNKSGIFGRSMANLANSTRQLANKKIFNKAELKEIDTVLADKYRAYNKAAGIKDRLQTEVEKLLRGEASPAVTKTALKEARKELDAANLLLDNVELELRHAMVPIGAVEAIPSMTTLERRIGFLRSRKLTPEMDIEVTNAELAIANYKGVLDKMAINTTVIRDADNALSAAYGDIDKIVNEMKPSLKAKADVWGKNQEFKKRYYAKDSQMRMVNGQYMSIESFVAEDAPFSAAIRAEISNARTVDNNYLGELSVKTQQGIINRKIPKDTVRISDPAYFDELKHIANRQFRGDPLIDLILADTSMPELLKWAKSTDGARYLEHFDVYETKQVAPYLLDKIALVQRTFPTTEVRNAILKHEVTTDELMSMLSSHTDELYDIIPANFAYGVSDALEGSGKYAVVSNVVNAASSAIFRRMASAENPIRNAFFDNVALDAVARKASILMKQGVDMTPQQWNALRQSAGREAIQELEKTVYTIRRQNRLLHTARAAVAFPTATVNAFYRYGRLAVKNPSRATGFTFNYGRTFQNFGVDENGNPTTDINAITHIIVPGTSELKLGFMGEGVALNARSIGFLLNQPSPSFISAISVGTLMKKFPGTEQGIRDAMNVGGLNLFDTWFPYGAPTDLTKVFTPPYINSLYNAATGNQGKADYLSSAVSVYNYHHMLVEMGIEKKMPSDKLIDQEIRSLWADKFLSGFVSIAGVPYKVETNPMRMTTNLYFKLVDKYNKMGYSTQNARDAAGNELLATVGTKFMLDRITTSNTGKNLSIPATYESWKRVFKDNDALVGTLAAIDSNDIGLVSLLTADLSRDPGEQSTNILKILSDPNLVLPGTSQKINNLKLTPQEVETERMKNRTWSQYMLVRGALESKITDGKTLRSHPELKVVLDQLVESTFKNQSQAWYDDYQLAASGDKSYKYARAISTITNDTNFMTKNGNTQFWHDAQLFMKARNIFTTFYQSLPDYDTRKANVREAYNMWVAENAKQWDPNLGSLITFYFENDTMKAVN